MLKPLLSWKACTPHCSLLPSQGPRVPLQLCKPPCAARPGQAPSLPGPALTSPSLGSTCPRRPLGLWLSFLCLALWLFRRVSDLSPLPDLRLRTLSLCTCGASLHWGTLSRCRFNDWTSSFSQGCKYLITTSHVMPSRGVSFN